MIDGLDGTLFCPAGERKAQLGFRYELKFSPVSAAPWDAYWALPGYTWLVGPFARRHADEGEIQMNSSEAIFREIPVVGSEDALRLMVVFKHPTVRHKPRFQICC